MSLQSSRLSSILTTIVKVSNNGTFGATTTTVYTLRRNYMAVQWRNAQTINTYMRTQQFLSVHKIIGSTTTNMLSTQIPNKSINCLNTRNCSHKLRCDEDKNKSVDNTSDSTTVSGSNADSKKNPECGFCAGITRDEENLKSDGKKILKAPDIKLPNRHQVEKTFFRALAFVYDTIHAIMAWTRKFICKYIILNPTVQTQWQRLRTKMEESKRD